MLQNPKYRGLLTIIGALLLSSCSGLIYVWAIVCSYAHQYLNQRYSSEISLADTNVIFVCNLLGQSLSIAISGRMLKKTHNHRICRIICCIWFMVIYMSSYASSISIFVLLYGICAGIIIGIVNTISKIHCYQHYPYKKPLINAIIFNGGTIGAIIMILIMLSDEGQFNNFSHYIRQLSIITSILMIVGSFMLLDHQLPEDRPIELQLIEKKHNKNPFGNMHYQSYNHKPSNDRKEEYWPQISESDHRSSTHKSERSFYQPTESDLLFCNVRQCPRIRDAVRQKVFWFLFGLMMLTTNFSIFMTYNYKNYPSTYSEKQLMILGIIGIVLCCLSRIIWYRIVNNSAFVEKGIWFALLLNFHYFLSLSHIDDSKYLYYGYVLIAYTLLGALMQIFETITSKIFGERYHLQIYALLSTSYGLIALIQISLVKMVGMQYMLIIAGFISLIGLLLCGNVLGWYESGYDWSQRVQEHNQRRGLLMIDLHKNI